MCKTLIKPCTRYIILGVEDLQRQEHRELDTHSRGKVGSTAGRAICREPKPHGKHRRLRHVEQILRMANISQRQERF